MILFFNETNIENHDIINLFFLIVNFRQSNEIGFLIINNINIVASKLMILIY